MEVDGKAWGTTVTLTSEWSDVMIPLTSLRPVSLALLPRPFPEFLPDEWWNDEAPLGGRGLELSDVDGIQIRIGAALYDADTPDRSHGFEVERIMLVRRLSS